MGNDHSTVIAKHPDPMWSRHLDTKRFLDANNAVEGVQTMAHAGNLRNIGYGLFWGSAFSTPLPADALAPFMTLRTWSAA